MVKLATGLALSVLVAVNAQNRGNFNPFAMLNQNRDPTENRNTNRRNTNRRNNNRNNDRNAERNNNRNNNNRESSFKNEKSNTDVSPDLSNDIIGSAAAQLNLDRFRGNEVALRSMPQIMIINAYALNVESSTENKMDKIFMQAFREKANKDGVPDQLYETIIQKLVTGTTDVDQLVAGNTRSGGPAFSGGLRTVLADGDSIGVNSNFCPAANCDVPLSLDGIFGYGCWCTFEIDATPGIMDGSSLPVNKFDAACMNMKRCLRCAKHDGVNAEPSYECDARYNRNFNADYTVNIDTEELTADCSAQNPGNECGAHMCSCENNLVAELLDLLWEGEVYDADYLHAQGFSQEDSCPSTSHNASPERECCGQYPARHFVDAEVFHCCESLNPFNIFTEQCCGDGLGTVTDAGEC